MSADYAWATRAETEPGRDRWGRPLVVPPGGGKPVAYTRCTTFVGCLEDTYNLGQWQRRMVAAGLAARSDLLLRASSLGLQPADNGEAKRWKAAMNEVCDKAQEAAQASASATIGTALHELTERIDRGETLGPVPADYQPHLAAYRAATAGFGVRHIERFTVHDGLQIGGTPDRVLEVDGRLVIGDVKSGDTVYGIGKIAMQLAVYAQSQLYDPATGERTPLDGIDLEQGLVIALNAKTGTCELKWVDLAAGWEAVQLAAQVRRWRSRKDLSQPYGSTVVPLLPPDPDTEPTTAATQAAFESAIRTADSVEELKVLWRDAGPAWTEHHTALAAARKAELQL